MNNTEIKKCPFCGEGFRTNSRGAYEHENEKCILHGLEIRNAKQLEAWNARKLIDDTNDKLRKLADLFIKGNSHNVAAGIEKAIEIVNETN